MSEQPEQDARIRALLADLGSGAEGEALPPDVAARLDDTLARLLAERGGAEEPVTEERPAPVVPLRRRWLPRATAAAAAVIALGVGGLAASELGVFGTDEALITSESGGASSEARKGGAVEAALPQLSASAFADEVDELLRSGGQEVSTPERRALSAESGDAQAESDTRGLDDGTVPTSPNAMSRTACPGPRTTAGAVANQVLYDGRPAVLVVHPERTSRAGSPASRLVEAWDCAGDRKLDSVRLTR